VGMTEPYLPWRVQPRLFFSRQLPRSWIPDTSLHGWPWILLLDSDPGDLAWPQCAKGMCFILYKKPG
jgi:hypothetical protein